MIQELINQLVEEYNQGQSIHQIAQKHKLQHHHARALLEMSGQDLNSLEYCSNERLLKLNETMDLEEMSKFLHITPLTLKKHLRKRNLVLRHRKTKDEIYIEKQVAYLFLREGLSVRRIADSLGVELNRVSRIIKAIKDKREYASNRSHISSLSSVGESGGHFIEYSDLANVFPKKRKYARAY